jgi:hypothetical protein
VMWVKWKLILVHLEIMSISMQDRFMVCAECAIGSEIILGTLDGTPMWRWSMEAHFGLFGGTVISAQHRCMIWDEHTIGSEIILGTADGTPR